MGDYKRKYLKRTYYMHLKQAHINLYTKTKCVTLGHNP